MSSLLNGNKESTCRQTTATFLLLSATEERGRTAAFFVWERLMMALVFGSGGQKVT
ncbi:MAG TPA: hypothetical protein VFE61_05525 [Candidatus Sulfotelmatobacter sp.]|jgi:hypothetical protein|nr:hypothetical protein [Candidatus Sulfotelmatobacter sp.]